MSRLDGTGAASADAHPAVLQWDPGRATSFWLLAALLAGFLFAASAPSPLYPLFQARWHFSSVTLTEVYAVYAFGALAGLLLFGRVSDRVGRRRATAVGLLLQLGSMLVFIGAQTVAFLAAARILQGLGTGLASGAITAWMLDLQPPDEPRLGGLVSGIALIAGLALGALGSSLLAQYAPDPLHLVFWLLAAFYVVALAAIARMPDLVQRRPGWLRTVRPEVAVPASARSAFAATAPSLIAAWAIAGFYLSLGPSLAISLAPAGSRLTGGLVIVALLGSAAVASFIVRASEPGPSVVRGSLVLVVGVALTLLSVALGSIVGLFLASAIAGLGFGPAFSGVFRSVTALAPPDRRGALVAAVYIVVYLAFSVPTILAGVSVTLYGLRPTTYAFGLIVIGLSGMTTLAISRRVTSAAPAT